MNFKYDAELRRYENCPPINAKPFDKEAFRFVFEDINNERNFLPVAKVQPKRRLKTKNKCLSWSLSMFASKDQAKARYSDLVKGHARIRQSIGTHLAVGVLSDTDGMASEARKDGHFSFFESDSACLSSTFKLVEEL